MCRFCLHLLSPFLLDLVENKKKQNPTKNVVINIIKNSEP